jgi:ATP-binding cassette subfamily F protein 3
MLVLRNVGHAYGTHQVFKGIDLEIRRGEKIGLVGVNGAGKTTLLRILAGRETPREGECVVGRRVQRVYFAQYDTDTISSETTLLDAIGEAAPTGQAQRARDLLGAFLFGGDDVSKPLRVLSGGERTRFRIARILFSPANLLLLDEPTNHLDITSRATVERALAAYTGTVVIVSHDRAFMDRVTNRIVELDRGTLRTYPGSYSEYLEHARRLIAENGAEEPAAVERGAAEGAAAKGDPPRGARRIRALKKRILAVEKKIERQETLLAEADLRMADPAIAASYEELAPIAEERSALASEHQRLLQEWESLGQELEASGDPA